MRAINRIARRFGFEPISKRHGGFAAALHSRLTADILKGSGSPNADLFASNTLLRERAQGLEKNNALVRRYLHLVAENVVGPKGFALQARTGSKRNDATIENGYYQWAQPTNYSIDGRTGAAGFQQSVIRGVARDGEAFVRKIRGGPYGFAMQLIDPALVDETYNRAEGNGNAVKMGIEVDGWGRAVAYHILTGHQYDITGARSVVRVRIPGDEILHLFIQRRPGQVRGESWLAPVMVALHQLDGYADAELVAARTAAAKMGFIVTKGDDPAAINPDEVSRPLMEASSGTIDYLEQGQEFQSWDPSHPSQNFALFVTQISKFIAAGLNVSFAALTSDLRETNFSSARIGLLQERDAWRIIQHWMIDAFCEPVYTEWRQHAWTTGRIALRMTPDQYTSHVWQPRGWSYTNPQQEQQADMLSIAGGLKSPLDIIGENGDDPEDVLDGIAAWHKMAEAKGITLYTPNSVIDPNAKSGTDGTPDANADDRDGRDGGESGGRYAHPRVTLVRHADQTGLRERDTATYG